jgi:hypothetical protein
VLQAPRVLPALPVPRDQLALLDPLAQEQPAQLGLLVRLAQQDRQGQREPGQLVLQGQQVQSELRVPQVLRELERLVQPDLQGQQALRDPRDPRRREQQVQPDLQVQQVLQDLQDRPKRERQVQPDLQELQVLQVRQASQGQLVLQGQPRRAQRVLQDQLDQLDQLELLVPLVLQDRQGRLVQQVLQVMLLMGRSYSQQPGAGLAQRMDALM